MGLKTLEMREGLDQSTPAATEGTPHLPPPQINFLTNIG